jgi:hypothetical protein
VVFRGGGGTGRNRKIALLVAACLTVVAVAAVVAWLNRPSDETSKATVNDAIRSFRARRSDGLLLSRWSQTEADSSEGGGSHYSERYTIRLLSTTPRR